MMKHSTRQKANRRCAWLYGLIFR